MLPRWLTALPNLVTTYRDELLVVALGLAYQAATGGALTPRWYQDHGEHEVVVRIAEAPVTEVVVTEPMIHVAPLPSAAPIAPGTMVVAKSHAGHGGQSARGLLGRRGDTFGIAHHRSAQQEVVRARAASRAPAGTTPGRY